MVLGGVDLSPDLVSDARSTTEHFSDLFRGIMRFGQSDGPVLDRW